MPYLTRVGACALAHKWFCHLVLRCLPQFAEIYVREGVCIFLLLTCIFVNHMLLFLQTGLSLDTAIWESYGPHSCLLNVDEVCIHLCDYFQQVLSSIF